jgi:hypothetical protein
VARLYDLFLLSDSERVALQEAEEAFLIGRAHGWTREWKNLQTQKPEIRFEYEIPGRIGVRASNFGPNWDSALEKFTQDAIAPVALESDFREGRLRMTDKAQILRKEAKTSPEKWTELFGKMQSYLAQSLETYPARSDDTRYQRDQAIIDRIIDSHQA